MTTVALSRRQTTLAYRRSLGRFEITALADGFVDLSFAVWQNIDRDTFDTALQAKFLAKGGFRNGIASFVVNTGSKVLLVDAGAAGLFGPNSHHFPGNLAHAGLAPEQVDDVLLTHAHPDHIGGLLRDGAAVLPRAILHFSARELEFWTSPAEQARAPEFMRSWWDVVGAVAKAYDGRVRTFGPEETFGTGIAALPFPGHTPGHTAYLVESDGERLLICGDLAVHHAIQFPHPKASMIFDIDAEEAYRSRLRGFDFAARERLAIAGTHLPFPTFGHVARQGDAFVYVPEEWRHDLQGTPWVAVA